MKILLINPPTINKIWIGVPKMLFGKGIFIFPPLGFMYIQAYLRKFTGHQIDILDALPYNLSYRDIENRIKREKPGIVGITCLTHNLIDVVETIKSVKRVDGSIHVCLGGPHVRTYPRQSIELPGVDSVVADDGEVIFTELVKTLEQKRDLRKVRGLLFKKDGTILDGGTYDDIINLDSLPFPERKLEGYRKYYTPATEGSLMTTMITSRGCPYQCTFCDTSKKYRSRSASNIVDELQMCVGEGINEFYFIDDTFNITLERVMEISEEILRRGLKVKWGFKARCDSISPEMLKLAKKAGCYKIHYGVETGTDEGLKRLNKKITLQQIKQTFKWTREAKIKTIAFFMLGCPYETTEDEIRKTITFSNELTTDYAVFSLFSPYPDTQSYIEGRELGLFNGEWERFIGNPHKSYRLPTCWEQHFTKKELFRLLKLAHRKFYYRSEIFLSTLLDIHSFAELKRIFRCVLALLKLEFVRNPDGKL